MTVEDLAKLIAMWHGQKMVYRDRDGQMQTVSSSRGYGHWGDSSERYMHAHWQEYVSAAEVILPMLAGPAVQEWHDARLALCATKINTPECLSAFTRLGQAEDALSKVYDPRKRQEARQ